MWNEDRNESYKCRSVFMMMTLLLLMSVLNLRCYGDAAVAASNGSGVVGSPTIVVHFHLAYIAQEVTPVIELLAESQRLSVEQSIQSIRDSFGATPTIPANATLNITMQVFASRDVTTPEVLYNADVVHATYADGLNLDIVIHATNVTFSVFQQPATTKTTTASSSSSTSTSIIEELHNMELVLLPIEASALQTGLLAASITSTKIIALLYGHFYKDSINGVREAINQICPLCTLIALGVCSGSFACPGQFERFLNIAQQADVVIVAVHVSNFLPRQIMDFNIHNATARGMSRKYVITLGNILNDVAPDVAKSSCYVGYLQFVMNRTLGNIVNRLAFGNFTPTVQTAPVVWSRSFLNASRNPGITELMLSHFILSQRLFTWGTYIPTYSAIDEAAADAPLVGGAPFSFIGNVLTGYPLESSSVQDPFVMPELRRHNLCTLHDRMLLLSADLTTLTILSAEQAQIKTISLPLTDADYAEGSNISMLKKYYDISRRLSPDAAPRVDMTCSVVPDDTYGNPTAWILTGGTVVDENQTALSPTESPRDVLRLRLVCIDPYSIWCDFFVIENMTDTFVNITTPTPATGGQQGEGSSWLITGAASKGYKVDVVSPTGVLATRSNVSLLLPHYADLSSWEIASAADGSVVMDVVVRPDYATVHKTIRVKPPAAVGTNASLFIPSNVTWVAALRGIMGYDPLRFVFVFLPILDTILSPTTGSSATSSWWGEDGPQAAPSSLQWVDYTSPLPQQVPPDDATTTATAVVGAQQVIDAEYEGFFYSPGLDRIVVALRPMEYPTINNITTTSKKNTAISTAHTVLVLYHYSRILGQWFLMSRLTHLQAPSTNEAVHDVEAIPLPDIQGGAMLMYPLMPLPPAGYLYVVEYPLLIASCNTSGGYSLSADGGTCTACPVGYVASSDAFCTPSASVSVRGDTWWLALVIALPIGFVLVTGLGLVALYVYQTRWSRTGRMIRLSESASATAYAPPGGRCAILNLMIVDADLMWETLGENLFSDSEDGDESSSSNSTSLPSPEAVVQQPSSSNGVPEQRPPRRAKRSPRRRPTIAGSAQLVLSILDYLHESLCSSVVANKGFLASYRGETSVVVHNNPEALLCIALEVSLAMAHHRPPVRLAIGFHIGNLVRTNDTALDRCNFVGQGMIVAARIGSLFSNSQPNSNNNNNNNSSTPPAATASVSTTPATNNASGATWTASQQFLDAVDAAAPHAMTALSLGRGDQLQLRYEGVVTVAQVITCPLLNEALGDQSLFDLARKRRNALLMERRRRHRSFSRHAATTTAQNSSENSSGGDNAATRTIRASKPNNKTTVKDAIPMSEVPSAASRRSGGEQRKEAAAKEKRRRFSAMLTEEQPAIGKKGDTPATPTVVSSHMSTSIPKDALTRRSSTNPLAVPSHLAASAPEGELVRQHTCPSTEDVIVDPTGGTPPTTGDPPPVAQRDVNPSPTSASSNTTGGVGDSDLDMSTRSQQQQQRLREITSDSNHRSPSVGMSFEAAELFVTQRSAPTPPTLIGNSVMPTVVVQSHHPTAAASSRRQVVKVGGEDLCNTVASPTLGTSQRPSSVNNKSSGGEMSGVSDSNTNASPASPYPSHWLDAADTEQLVVFASHFGRVLLTQLPADVVDIFVTRLHLTNLRRDSLGRVAATVPRASLRHFGQRIVAMGGGPLAELLFLTRAQQSAAGTGGGRSDSHNTSATHHNISARSGSGVADFVPLGHCPSSGGAVGVTSSAQDARANSLSVRAHNFPRGVSPKQQVHNANAVVPSFIGHMEQLMEDGSGRRGALLDRVAGLSPHSPVIGTHPPQRSTSHDIFTAELVAEDQPAAAVIASGDL
jgi:hypothetical protein